MDGFSIWLATALFLSWLIANPVPAPEPVPQPVLIPQPVPVPQPVQEPQPKLKETFILLPDAEGKKTGIVVKTNEQEVAVTEPFHAVELTGGKVLNKTVTAEEVGQQFPEVMQALPEKPHSYILRFGNNLAKLDSESLVIIKEIQQDISRRPKPEIMVIGHTDRVGKADDNLRLSLQRAETVRDILVEGGVSAKIIEAVGRGELEPLVPTEEGVAEPQNRRVEIIIR